MVGTTVISRSGRSGGPGEHQAIAVPRCLVTRNEVPNSARPAVAPSVTTALGSRRASSAASHGQQARTCQAGN